MGNETNRRATAAEKRKKALDLRRAGRTYEDIAKQVGYANKSVAYKAVQKGIADITTESAKELVTLHFARLEDMLAGIYKKASNGNVWAIDRARGILQDEAKLLGLYDRKPDDTSTEVKGALLDFAAGLKGLFDGDTYGEVTDGDSADDVPGDSQPGT